MSRAKDHQLSLGGLLLGIASIGLLIALLLDRRLTTEIGQVIALCCLGWLAFLATMAVMEGVLGINCPSCRAAKMKRVAITTFGYRFFRCPNCRERWRKGILSDWAPVEEDEASVYDRKESPDPWSRPPEAIEEPLTWSETHSNLLRNKQARNPNAVRQEKSRPVE